MDLDQILLHISFDYLDEDEEKYEIKIKNRNGITTNFALEPIVNRDVDLSAPINLKSLILPDANTAYSDINCKKDIIKTIQGNTGDINWDNNKPLFYAQYQDTKNDVCCSGLEYCSINNNKYILFPGWTDAQGYCNYLHSRPMNNLNNKYMSNGNPFCVDKETIYDLFYSCENKETKYYLQYSGFYNPGSLCLGFGEYGNLTYYTIEFWYYPDFF